jgi:hypothetical protein
MSSERILITVKTYPRLDPNHYETVCTAGLREDGSWVRIYPVPFRQLKYYKRYSKYQWITLDLKKNTSDYRPESYKPVNYERIKLGEKVGTENGWSKRKKVVLKKVYDDISLLIKEAKNKDICTSLAVFKPRKITKFIIEKDDRDWKAKTLEILRVKAKQTNLFSQSVDTFKLVSKVPYKFSYEFMDKNNKSATLMIIDWEICQLYWKCLGRHGGNESLACADVRKKYLDDFAKTKDLYLFLGTTWMHHFLAPNPFIIIGTFHPPIDRQGELFQE